MSSDIREPVSSGLSSGALALLVEQGYSRAEIAGFMGRSESFVSLVFNKKRNLTVGDLESLEEATGLPIGVLVIQSFKRKKRVPAYMREFYDAAEKVLKSVQALAEREPPQARRSAAVTRIRKAKVAKSKRKEVAAASTVSRAGGRTVAHGRKGVDAKSAEGSRVRRKA